MSRSTFNLGRAIAANRGAFLMAIAVGAVLMLGVRSLFVDAGGSPSMAEAAPAQDHHAEAGHEGHGHGAPVMAPEEDDGHGVHGKKQHGTGADDQKKAGEKAAAGSKDRAETGAKPEHVTVLLDLNNTACPMMGGDVDGKTFTEWNGLRVGHCCPGCSEDFLANPENLLDEVSPKWRDAAKAAKAIDSAQGERRAKLLESTGKTWKVVRQPTGNLPAKRAEPAGLLVNLGNATCPVMGGDVNGKTFTDWNGLRVGHCCPGCTKRFLANPEALLDEVAPKWREAAVAVKKVNDAEGAAQKQALETLRKNWTVVREPAPAPTK